MTGIKEVIRQQRILLSAIHGLLLAILTGTPCVLAEDSLPPSYGSIHQQQIIQEASAMEADHLCLLINETEVNVIWEDNEAVAALKNAAAQTPIIVYTSLYGGFEQVGSLPQAFPRHDTPITTRPGDIMLFSGDQLVVFFGENQWGYTPLGHIADRTDEELTSLLGGDTAIMEIRMN